MVNVLFQTLNDLIKSSFKNSFTGGQINLVDSTSKPVILTKTGTVLCIQPDKKISYWKNNFPFFETSLGLSCSVSDHIVFYPKNEKLFVYIIELKSGNPTDAIKQVRANYELSKYICETARRLCNYPNVEIIYRGLIFSTKPIYKGTTKPKKFTYTTDTISGLLFRHLQSGNKYSLDMTSV